MLLGAGGPAEDLASNELTGGAPAGFICPAEIGLSASRSELTTAGEMFSGETIPKGFSFGGNMLGATGLLELEATGLAPGGFVAVAELGGPPKLGGESSLGLRPAFSIPAPPAANAGVAVRLAEPRSPKEDGFAAELPAAGLFAG